LNPIKILGLSIDWRQSLAYFAVRVVAEVSDLRARDGTGIWLCIETISKRSSVGGIRPQLRMPPAQTVFQRDKRRWVERPSHSKVMHSEEVHRGRGVRLARTENGAVAGDAQY